MFNFELNKDKKIKLLLKVKLFVFTCAYVTNKNNNSVICLIMFITFVIH